MNLESLSALEIEMRLQKMRDLTNVTAAVLTCAMCDRPHLVKKADLIEICNFALAQAAVRQFECEVELRERSRSLSGV